DFRAQTLTIPCSKNGQTRHIPLNDRGREEFNAFLASRKPIAEEPPQGVATALLSGCPRSSPPTRRRHNKQTGRASPGGQRDERRYLSPGDCEWLLRRCSLGLSGSGFATGRAR